MAQRRELSVRRSSRLSLSPYRIIGQRHTPPVPFKNTASSSLLLQQDAKRPFPKLIIIKELLELYYASPICYCVKFLRVFKRVCWENVILLE